MRDEQVDAMLFELLEQIDHDIAKDYNEDTAEEPEFVDCSINLYYSSKSNLEDLRIIVRKHTEGLYPSLQLQLPNSS